MILTKDNSDRTIGEALMAMHGLEFYDPQAGIVFGASPCTTCGTMSADANPVVIESVSGIMNGALSEMYKVMEFIEMIGFSDDGDEYCECCADKGYEVNIAAW